MWSAFIVNFYVDSTPLWRDRCLLHTSRAQQSVDTGPTCLRLGVYNSSHLPCSQALGSAVRVGHWSSRIQPRLAIHLCLAHSPCSQVAWLSDQTRALGWPGFSSPGLPLAFAWSHADRPCNGIAQITGPATQLAHHEPFECSAYLPLNKFAAK